MLSRRSFLGLLGGAFAALGLDGPAKAIRALIPKRKLIIYAFNITVAPEIEYKIETSEMEFPVINHAASIEKKSLEKDSLRWVAQGVIPSGGQMRYTIDDGLILDEDTGFNCYVWKRWGKDYTSGIEVAGVRCTELKGRFIKTTRLKHATVDIEGEII